MSRSIALLPRQAQVDASFYQLRDYLTLPRMITHWHQVNEVTECCPLGGSVVEIGVGCGHTTWLLRERGYRVVTVDLDPTVKPDLVGDVTRLPLDDGSADCILAAEVLEHIPFEEFRKALSELARVSRKHVIVTLPAPLIGVSMLLNTPGFAPRGVSIGLPYFRPHAFDGQHYWELGKLGFGKRRVRGIMREAGLIVEREFRPAPSLYCYFFVCRKEETYAS